MTGKRLGIVGLGRVGQVTARRARGFDMTIHYHDVQRCRRPRSRARFSTRPPRT